MMDISKAEHNENLNEVFHYQKQPRLIAPRLGTNNSSVRSLDALSSVHIPPSLGNGKIGGNRMFSAAVKATLINTTTSNIISSEYPKQMNTSIVTSEASLISAANHVTDISNYKLGEIGEGEGKGQIFLNYPIPKQLPLQTTSLITNNIVNMNRNIPMAIQRTIPHHIQPLQPPILSFSSQTQPLVNSSSYTTVGETKPNTTIISRSAAPTSKASPPVRHFRSGESSSSISVPILNGPLQKSLEISSVPITTSTTTKTETRASLLYDEKQTTLISTRVSDVPLVNAPHLPPSLSGTNKNNDEVFIKTLESTQEKKQGTSENDLLESLRSSIQLTNELLHHQHKPLQGQHQPFQTAKKEKNRESTITRNQESVFSMLLDSGSLDEPQSSENVQSKPLPNRTPGSIKISFVENDENKSMTLVNINSNHTKQSSSKPEVDLDIVPNLATLVQNDRIRKEQTSTSNQSRKPSIISNYSSNIVAEKDLVTETAELLFSKAAELRSKRNSITSSNSTISGSRQRNSIGSKSRRSSEGYNSGFIGIDVDSGTDQLLPAGPLITVTPPKVIDDVKYYSDDLSRNDYNTDTKQRLSLINTNSRREASIQSQQETKEVNVLADKILELASPHNSKSIIRQSSRIIKPSSSEIKGHDDYQTDAELAERLENLLEEGANVDELAATLAAEINRSDDDRVGNLSNHHEIVPTARSNTFSSNIMETAVAQVLSTQAQTATLISQQSEQFNRLMELQRVQSEQQAQILAMIASVASSTSRPSAPVSYTSVTEPYETLESRHTSPVTYTRHSSPVPTVLNSSPLHLYHARENILHSQPLHGTPHRILSPVSAFESRSQLARVALAEKAALDAAAKIRHPLLDEVVDSSNLYMAKDRLTTLARFHDDRVRRSPSPTPKVVSTQPIPVHSYSHTLPPPPTVRITTVTSKEDFSYSPTLSERLELTRTQKRQLDNNGESRDSRFRFPESKPFTSALSTRVNDLVSIPSIFTFIPKFSNDETRVQNTTTSIPSQIVNFMPQPFIKTNRPISAGRSRVNSSGSVVTSAPSQSVQPRTYAELMRVKSSQTPVAPLRRTISIGRIR